MAKRTDTDSRFRELQAYFKAHEEDADYLEDDDFDEILSTALKLAAESPQLIPRILDMLQVPTELQVSITIQGLTKLSSSLGNGGINVISALEALGSDLVDYSDPYLYNLKNIGIEFNQKAARHGDQDPGVPN